MEVGLIMLPPEALTFLCFLIYYCNEELHNLYSSPSTCNKNDQVKKDEMGGACSTNGEMRNAFGDWWESQKERDNCEGQHVGGWRILKCILERSDGMVWIGSILLNIETSGGFS
jgi:hypothetical protein